MSIAESTADPPATLHLPTGRGTSFREFFAALSAPFDPSEIRTREQAGRKFEYITARVAMNRLDTVAGPENWWDEFTPGEHSVLCSLTIRLPDGSILTKQDAGGYAGMADQGDDDKSGYSDAFKRACVKFGIGRYLYRDGVPEFAVDGPRTAQEPRRAAGDGTPGPGRGESRRGQQGRTERPDGPREPITEPKTGRALFAWVCQQEQKHEIQLLKYLNDWARSNGLRGKMVEWSPHVVADVHAEALRKLATVPGGQGETREDGWDQGRE